jgi:hypothetical protein
MSFTEVDELSAYRRKRPLFPPQRTDYSVQTASFSRM